MPKTFLYSVRKYGSRKISEDFSSENETASTVKTKMVTRSVFKPGQDTYECLSPWHHGMAKRPSYTGKDKRRDSGIKSYHHLSLVTRFYLGLRMNHMRSAVIEKSHARAALPSGGQGLGCSTLASLPGERDRHVSGQTASAAALDTPGANGAARSRSNTASTNKPARGLPRPDNACAGDSMFSGCASQLDQCNRQSGSLREETLRVDGKSVENPHPSQRPKVSIKAQETHHRNDDHSDNAAKINSESSPPNRSSALRTAESQGKPGVWECRERHQESQAFHIMEDPGEPDTSVLESKACWKHERRPLLENKENVKSVQSRRCTRDRSSVVVTSVKASVNAGASGLLRDLCGRNTTPSLTCLTRPGEYSTPQSSNVMTKTHPSTGNISALHSSLSTAWTDSGDHQAYNHLSTDLANISIPASDAYDSSCWNLTRPTASKHCEDMACLVSTCSASQSFPVVFASDKPGRAVDVVHSFVVKSGDCHTGQVAVTSEDTRSCCMQSRLNERKSRGKSKLGTHNKSSEKRYIQQLAARNISCPFPKTSVSHELIPGVHSSGFADGTNKTLVFSTPKKIRKKSLTRLGGEKTVCASITNTTADWLVLERETFASIKPHVLPMFHKGGKHYDLQSFYKNQIRVATLGPNIPVFLTSCDTPGPMKADETERSVSVGRCANDPSSGSVSNLSRVSRHDTHLSVESLSKDADFQSALFDNDEQRCWGPSGASPSGKSDLLQPRIEPTIRDGNRKDSSQGLDHDHRLEPKNTEDKVKRASDTPSTVLRLSHLRSDTDNYSATCSYEKNLAMRQIVSDAALVEFKASLALGHAHRSDLFKHQFSYTAGQRTHKHSSTAQTSIVFSPLTVTSFTASPAAAPSVTPSHLRATSCWGDAAPLAITRDSSDMAANHLFYDLGVDQLSAPYLAQLQNGKACRPLSLSPRRDVSNVSATPIAQAGVEKTTLNNSPPHFLFLKECHPFSTPAFDLLSSVAKSPAASAKEGFHLQKSTTSTTSQSLIQTATQSHLSTGCLSHRMNECQLLTTHAQSLNQIPSKPLMYGSGVFKPNDSSLNKDVPSAVPYNDGLNSRDHGYKKIRSPRPVDLNNCSFSGGADHWSVRPGAGVSTGSAAFGANVPLAHIDDDSVSNMKWTPWVADVSPAVRECSRYWREVNRWQEVNGHSVNSIYDYSALIDPGGRMVAACVEQTAKTILAARLDHSGASTPVTSISPSSTVTHVKSSRSLAAAGIESAVPSCTGTSNSCGNSSSCSPGSSASAGGKPARLDNVCPVCSRLFTRSWLLKGHMRTHTGERPYLCPEPACQKAFADRSNLRSHMLTHTAVAKSFPCPRCGRTFSQKRYLHKHKTEVCNLRGHR